MSGRPSLDETERAEGWRDQVRLLLTAIQHGYERGPGCGRDDCPCAHPMPICPAFVGIPGETGRWCPRCGWEKAAHPSDGEPS